ncbi:hypothetical protein C8Q77DRAFT_1089146 [Trametes polyzona]|nr:hypothetical protein C8Q77DRAFT_1089146 [Trametes polyzona]
MRAHPRALCRAVPSLVIIRTALTAPLDSCSHLHRRFICHGNGWTCRRARIASEVRVWRFNTRMADQDMSQSHRLLSLCTPTGYRFPTLGLLPVRESVYHGRSMVRRPPNSTDLTSGSVGCEHRKRQRSHLVHGFGLGILPAFSQACLKPTVCVLPAVGHRNRIHGDSSPDRSRGTGSWCLCTFFGSAYPTWALVRWRPTRSPFHKFATRPGLSALARFHGSLPHGHQPLAIHPRHLCVFYIREKCHWLRRQPAHVVVAHNFGDYKQPG